MSKSKSKSKGKRSKSRAVRGKQRTLPLKGLRAPKVAKADKPRRPWKKEWGAVSPLVNGRLPAPLAKAWRKHVGKRPHSDVFREAIAKACGFDLKSIAKDAE